MRIEAATDNDKVRAEITDNSKAVHEQALDIKTAILAEDNELYSEVLPLFREAVGTRPARDIKRLTLEEQKELKPNLSMSAQLSFMVYGKEDAAKLLAGCYTWHSGGMVQESGDGYLIESKGYQGNKEHGWSV